MIKSFAKSDVRNLRNEIDAALAVVAAKHGVDIFLGNCRYEANEARFAKLTIRTKTPALTYNPIVAVPSTGIANGDPYNTVESREYVNLCYRFALPKDGLGKKFRAANGNQYTIIGLKSSRYKFPITAISDRGARYKFPAQTVLNGFGK